MARRADGHDEQQVYRGKHGLRQTSDRDNVVLTRRRQVSAGGGQGLKVRAVSRPAAARVPMCDADSSVLPIRVESDLCIERSLWTMVHVRI